MRKILKMSSQESPKQEKETKRYIFHLKNLDTNYKSYIIVPHSIDLYLAIENFYKDLEKINLDDRCRIEYINHIPDGVLPAVES